MRIAALLTSTALLGAFGSGFARAQTPAVYQTPASSSTAIPTETAATPAPTPSLAPVLAPTPAPAASGTVTAVDPHAIDSPREHFLALARASYLDKTGKTALPALEIPTPVAEAFASDVAALKTLEAQAAFVETGRGAESVPDYADMVVLVAARLGVKPPESALSVYRDRVRTSSATLTPELTLASAQLTADVHARAYKSRYLYLSDVVATPVDPLKPITKLVSNGRRGSKAKRRRVIVAAPPPEPQGPAESVLDTVDWDRAEELASVAENGAQGWYKPASRKKVRREQRKRRGRCYEWVRMALQETGLWTNEYRDEVPQRGDWRRPRRAFSFAWAMNLLETREQKDPADARKAPLRRLDLRVDPLVIGSIIVFDRNVCGFNASSGHIEVVSSIEPLRASSYKFHEVKLPCLIGAANAGRVHVYVPRRTDLPVPAHAASSAPLVPTEG
ncbi:MAG: hypothetical protein ACHQ49_17160 [Elusimicrobiota bacterium]